MALSDVAIKKALPKEKVYRLYDGDGLYLAVYPNGKKGWRLRYKRQGKETMLSLGSYPSVSLKDARVERDKINILRSKDIDPSAERRRSVEKVKTEQTTFMKVKDEWLEKHRPPVWSQAHYDKTVIRLKHVLALHETPIADITPPMILDILRPIEARGTHETAHRVLGICSMIFRYAVATGQVISDPCRDLSGALTPVVVTNNAAITNPLEVGKLLLDIDAYVGSAVVHRALRLAPLVFLRPTELRAAEWSEIDFAEAEWRIPKERMKMNEQHIVPLSRQALEILEEVRAMTGHGRFVFPSIRSQSRCMSDNTITAALRRMGYTGNEMTGHGFRAMASTLLNELGWKPDLIERQLAHAERNKVRAAYNRASYLSERREMMQAWADYLSELKVKARARELSNRLTHG